MESFTAKLCPRRDVGTRGEKEDLGHGRSSAVSKYESGGVVEGGVLEYWSTGVFGVLEKSPEGARGLSAGFQPWETHPTSDAP
jgi:hypothetical protein